MLDFHEVLFGTSTGVLLMMITTADTGTSASAKKCRLTFLIALILAVFLSVIALLTANDTDVDSLSCTKFVERDESGNNALPSDTSAKVKEFVLTRLPTSISSQENYGDPEFSDLIENNDDVKEEDYYFFAFLRRPDDNDNYMENQKRRNTQQSTSTRVNIFQKMGESIGLSIVGCCLIAFMPCLIWKNEGRHVDQLSRIDFCKNNAIAVDWYVSMKQAVSFQTPLSCSGGSMLSSKTHLLTFMLSQQYTVE
jgi:hypothetical protein